MVGVGEPQRLEHDRIDDVEHRGVEPDAEGEREQRDGREPGRLGELAEGEAEVLEHGSESESESDE